MTRLEADDDSVDGMVVDMLLSQLGKEQGIAVGIAMARGSGEAGTSSCRWLGHDAEQGGGAAVVCLQRGEAWGEAMVKEGAAKAVPAGRSSRARRCRGYL